LKGDGGPKKSITISKTTVVPLSVRKNIQKKTRSGLTPGGERKGSWGKEGYIWGAKVNTTSKEKGKGG